jgi:hypothetical protein
MLLGRVVLESRNVNVPDASGKKPKTILCRRVFTARQHDARMPQGWVQVLEL